jgi:hypothetical protein
MTSQPESDVIVLVHKLIEEGQIFSISLEGPESPAVKIAREGGLNSSRGFTQSNCHCVKWLTNQDGTVVCVEEKCDQADSGRDKR